MRDAIATVLRAEYQRLLSQAHHILHQVIYLRGLQLSLPWPHTRTWFSILDHLPEFGFGLLLARSTRQIGCRRLEYFPRGSVPLSLRTVTDETVILIESLAFDRISRSVDARRRPRQRSQNQRCTPGGKHTSIHGHLSLNARFLPARPQPPPPKRES